jgi:tetratricopeptide (TPR) repeat protein
MAPDAAVKPSTADYPVEPAERVSQQERLRKAAAAGADALKSPLPSLVSRPPSSPVTIPQKPAEPQAALTQSSSSMEPAPRPDQDLHSEIPAPRRTAEPQLRENEEILAELKKIAAWADMQRKITKWTFIVLAVLIPAMIGAGILMEQRATTNLEATVTRQKPDWYDVEHNVRAGDFEKAIGIGEELILKTPQFPEAHQRLAGAYLASGNIEKAREHYAEAFRLFPSEENEKLLEAVDKRSKADKP